MDQGSNPGAPAPRVETRVVQHRHVALAVLAEAVMVHRSFKNWLPVYWLLLVRRVRNQPPALRLRSRQGPILETLAGDRSWRTCVEVSGRDRYRLATLRLPVAATVADIGANLGALALAVRTARPKAQLFSFEPSLTAGGMLAPNVGRGKPLGSRTTQRPVAVTGSGAGDLRTSSIQSGTRGEPVVRETEVPDCSLVAVLRSCPDGVYLIKIGAEGATDDMICPTPPAMLRVARQWVMEYHPVAGHSFEELARQLQLTGFSCSRPEPRAVPGQGLARRELREGAV